MDNIESLPFNYQVSVNYSKSECYKLLWTWIFSA